MTSETQKKFSALVSLLGEEDFDNLKKQITDWLIAKVVSDIDDYTEYMLYPPDVKNLINDAMESSEKKLSKMYKDMIFDMHKEILDEMRTYLLDRHSGNTDLKYLNIDVRKVN